MEIIGVRTIYGNYGRQMQVDEDGNEIETKVEQPKRGRGRPKSLVNVSKMEFNPRLIEIVALWAKSERIKVKNEL